MTTVEQHYASGHKQPNQTLNDDDLDKELDWLIGSPPNQRSKNDSDSDEAKIKVEMNENEKELNTDADTTLQQRRYLQHLQQRENEEFDGSGDEGYEDTEASYTPSALSNTGDSFQPPSPSPPSSPEFEPDYNANDQFETQSEQSQDNHSDPYDQSGASTDAVSENGDDKGIYAENNANHIDPSYNKVKEEYEADDTPMKRSHENLSADPEDQREPRRTADSSMSPDTENGSPGWSADDDGYLGGYSADQKQAMTELQQLRLELDYTEEDPPEYNVAERVRQLNEELAQEDAPDDERERSIKFKDNLVDLVAPPPDYPSEDEEEVQEGQQAGGDRTSSANEDDSDISGAAVVRRDFDGIQPAGDMNDATVPAKGDKNNNDSKNIDSNQVSSVVAARKKKEKHSDKSNGNKSLSSRKSPPEMTGKKKQQSRGSQNSANTRKRTPEKNGNAKSETKTEVGKKSNGEKILVERDGKFELLDVNDLTAEERQLYLAPTQGEEEEENQNDASTMRLSTSFQPSPPADPRPATAGPPSNRKTTNVAPRRVQSARSKSVENQPILEDFNYTSPYALSEEQKRTLKEEKKSAAEREKKKILLAKMEAEEKSRENNEAFQAWLVNKRKEIAGKRRESTEKQKEQKAEEEEKKKERNENGAFDSWMKHKKEQKRKEKEMEQKRRECEESWDSPRQSNDSDKAFRRWMKKKKQDSRNAKLLEKQRVRIHKLMVRRSHKAVQLAKALRQSETLTNPDYYGYRY